MNKELKAFKEISNDELYKEYLEYKEKDLVFNIGGSFFPIDIIIIIFFAYVLAKKYEVETLRLLEENKLLVEMIADQLWKRKHLSQKKIEKIYKKYKEGSNNGCKKFT